MSTSRPLRIVFIAFCALVLLYLILPILIIVPMSFSSTRFLTFPPPALSLRWYQDYVGSSAWMQATRVTLTVALSTVAIASPLGVAAAYAISQSKLRIMRAIHMTLLLPLVVPIIITAVGIFFVYARVGLVATLHILLPFMVLPLYATMQKIPRDLMQAGASLGGDPVLVFLRVFLPLSLPGVLAGCTLVFVLSLGFYITPELLGGGRTIMVSMLVSRNVELYDQWGAASAVGMVLLAAVGVIFFAVSRIIPLDRVLGQK